MLYYIMTWGVFGLARTSMSLSPFEQIGWRVGSLDSRMEVLSCPVSIHIIEHEPTFTWSLKQEVEALKQWCSLYLRQFEAIWSSLSGYWACLRGLELFMRCCCTAVSTCFSDWTTLLTCMFYCTTTYLTYLLHSLIEAHDLFPIQYQSSTYLHLQLR